MTIPPFLKLFIKKISSTRVSTKREVLTNPYRDWSIVLVVFILVVIAFLLWSGFLFWRIETGQLFMGERKESSYTQIFNRSDLQVTLLEYQERSLLYENLLEESINLESPR